MAIANVQKQLLAAGKVNLVGDEQLYNTGRADADHGAQKPRSVLQRSTAIAPSTGNSCIRRAATAAAPDPKLLACSEGADRSGHAAHRAQIEAAKGTDRRDPSAGQGQAEIELARIKAELDAKWRCSMRISKAASEQQKLRNAQAQHQMNVTETALGIAATAHSQDADRGRSTARRKRTMIDEGRLDQAAAKAIAHRSCSITNC